MHAHPARINRRFDQELLLLVACQVNGLAYQWLQPGSVPRHFYIWLVVFLEEGGGEVPQTQRYVQGSADRCQVRLLSFLTAYKRTML